MSCITLLFLQDISLDLMSETPISLLSRAETVLYIVRKASLVAKEAQVYPMFLLSVEERTVEDKCCVKE